MGTEDGGGPDWFLLPGTLCTDAVFTPLLDELGVPLNRRHVIDLSFPDVEDYGFLSKMTAGAVVCGFSLGAIVAAHHADRLEARRLVLLGLNPLKDDPRKARDRRALAADVGALGGAAALAGRLPAFHGTDPHAVNSKVLEMADAAAQSIAAQTELALHRPGALSALGQSRCPVDVLTGSDDVMAPPELGRTAAAAAPLGQFDILDGLGHFALLEDPGACAQHIRQMEAHRDTAARPQ